MTDIQEYLREFIDEVKSQKFNIEKILQLKYFIKLKHLDVFDDREKELFFTVIWAELESYRNKLRFVRDEEISEYELFKAGIDFSFYEVEGYDDNHRKIRLRNLRNQGLDILKLTKPNNMKDGELIFGLSYGEPIEDESYLYENFIRFDKVESFMIKEQYDQGPYVEAIKLVLEQLILSRMVKKFIEEIEGIMVRHHKSLYEEFGEDVLFTFFKHFSDTSKYTLLTDGETSIYEIDYFEFLIHATTEGEFVMEGDLEMFIEVLEFILYKEAKIDKSKIKTYENILKAKENIFLLRENLNKHHPVTSLQLVHDVERKLNEVDIDVLKFHNLGFQIENIANLDEIEVTPKTKKLTLDTIRYIMADTSFTLEDDPEFEMEKEVIQLAFAMILGNKLGYLDSDNHLIFLNRLNYFSILPNSEHIANLLTGFFRKETFEYYFSYKDVNYEKLVDEIIKFLKTLDDRKLKQMKPGEKTIELLEALGFIRIGNVGEYELGTIGKFVVTHVYNDNQKARVLELSEFK